MCSFKDFEDQHYPLSNRCGIKKLSSQEILHIMDEFGSYPTWGFSHSINSNCRSTYQDGSSKACSKGCQHIGYPFNRAQCKHRDKALSYTVSKVGSNKAIPWVENLCFGIQSASNMIQDAN